MITLSAPQLEGSAVRLEPLSASHAEALAAAFRTQPDGLYRYADIPRTRADAEQFIERALTEARAGTGVPYATVKKGVDGESDRVVGTTRFWCIERWHWPVGHPWHGRETPDVCEIGGTYLAADAIRTGINVEAKLMMLTHAFEVWQVHRVSLRTDVRNTRSRTAIEALGTTFEGIRRADKVGADATVRDSAFYSMTISEWPARKEGLIGRLHRTDPVA